MKCPLCESRKAKRLCPAKATQICPVCCGTKREVEIDCPSSCVYLNSGREYETDKLARTAPAPPRTNRLWEPAFLQRHYPLMLGMAQAITQTRRSSPELIDSDVQATLDSLLQTFSTLNKGIYYDFSPERLTQKQLYFALRQFLEAPGEVRLLAESRWTTGQILDCLQFLKELSAQIVLPRPRSRAFLDHLEGVTWDSRQSSSHEPRLILPAEF
ncbi:MAG: hypothetical protein L0387_20310 [Acidobacteria bacterium]|nr:hypothetical protein [Acidobacteriota bacterium]MCI0623966.1 hypothetical protein [Acidobacteriota bacterium]MCI0724660.1 hypothetical protein [Acidobacteriota bacterium]